MDGIRKIYLAGRSGKKIANECLERVCELEILECLGRCFEGMDRYGRIVRGRWITDANRRTPQVPEICFVLLIGKLLRFIISAELNSLQGSMNLLPSSLRLGNSYGCVTRPTNKKNPVVASRQSSTGFLRGHEKNEEASRPTLQCVKLSVYVETKTSR